MEKTEEEVKRNYQENLKPEDLYNLKVESLRHVPDAFLSPLKVFHDIMKSGRFTGNSMLELGCGSSVHAIASASSYFSEIVQSDFVKANCDELRKWHRAESEQDWSILLKTVAELEGYEDLNRGCQEIEARIRRSVKAVVQGDVLSDQVVPPEVTVDYDVIMANHCLECAAPNFECFVTVLKRLNRLLRSGGGLIMVGFLKGEDNWKTDGGVFNYLTLSQEDIGRALDIAGFAEKQWWVFSPKKNFPWYKFQANYVVASRKM